MQQDTLVAVMAAMLRVDEIKERVGWYYRGDERYTYILDETGTVIVHPDSQQIKEHYNYKTGQKALVARDAMANNHCKMPTISWSITPLPCRQNSCRLLPRP